MASPLARRYAEACYGVARERVSVDPVAAELERARDILDDPRVRAVMSNPRVSLEERSAALDGSSRGCRRPPATWSGCSWPMAASRSSPRWSPSTAPSSMRPSGVVRIVVTSAAPLNRAPSGGSRGCSPSAWRVRPARDRPRSRPHRRTCDPDGRSRHRRQRSQPSSAASGRDGLIGGQGHTERWQYEATRSATS